MEKSYRKSSIRFLKPPGNFLSHVNGIFYPQNLHAVTGFSKSLFESHVKHPIIDLPDVNLARLWTLKSSSRDRISPFHSQLDR